MEQIDFQSHPDKEYKFIMVYRDHLTNFGVLRALKTKIAGEVTYSLIDIFTMLSAPSILQSDKGLEFANKMVSSLKEYCPTFIVHGKPRHSKAREVSKELTKTSKIFCLLGCKIKKNDHWSEGIRFSEEGLENIIEGVQIIQLEETDHSIEDTEVIAQNTGNNSFQD